MVMCADVNAKILDMIKAGEVFGSINPNQGMQGYMGIIALFLAKHPELIDPMNDAKRNGTNPMAVPFLDNGPRWSARPTPTTSTGTSTSLAAAPKASTDRSDRTAGRDCPGRLDQDGSDGARSADRQSHVHTAPETHRHHQALRRGSSAHRRIFFELRAGGRFMR